MTLNNGIKGVDIVCPYCGKVKNIKYFDSW